MVLSIYMCGRYTMTVDKSTIERKFGAKFVNGTFDHYEPTYNAAPSQLLPIITTYAPDQIVLAKWGFVPEEWKSPHIRPQNHARVETADVKPMFASSYAGRHCLVLADSFYEWKTVGTKKQPYRFVLKNGEPFAMAGIFARDHADHSRFNFAILTRNANEVMQPIHDRMPVMLTAAHAKSWLPPGG